MSGKPFKVVVSLPAGGDVRERHQYLLEQDAEQAADKFLDEFERLVDSLREWPMRGSRPRDLRDFPGPEFRQMLIGTMRVIYRVKEGTVTIALVADGRRDMLNLMKQRAMTAKFG